MRLVRVAWSMAFILAGLGGGLCRSVGGVSATTGNNATNPVPALYKVPHQIEILYPGQYSLKSAAGGSRLTRAQVAIEINSAGFLQGVASFYGYDAHGYQSQWVASLYNFRVIGPNRLSVEVLGPLGAPLLGKMYLQRTKQGDLVGQIALPKTPYAIAFHRNVAL
jgi:hypothetical protein